MKRCIDCVEDFDQDPEELAVFYDIQFEAPRPNLPALTTDYTTLAERLGFPLHPDAAKMQEIDTAGSFFTTTTFSIRFILEHDKDYNLIFDKPADLELYRRKTMIALVSSMTNPTLDSNEVERAILYYGYQVLKAKEYLDVNWFKGHESYIEFNCASGAKRLLYSREDWSSLGLKTKHLFPLKENWALFDNPYKRANTYIRIINRKRKRYGW